MKKIPNTLAPTNVINQEDGPWCLPCGDSHWEYECPRLHNNGNNEDPNNCEYMNFIDTLDPCLHHIIPRILQCYLGTT
jgi:hypothetical protein